MESFPDAHTEVVGVVGHPVRHSLSPAFWNAALRHEGRNAVFLAFDVAPEGFEDFVKGMATAGVRGLNVTMPHKAAAVACCQEVSEEAGRTDAANVIVFQEGRGSAHNTDVDGLRGALGELGFEASGSRVLVVGAGGAGRAAVWTLVSDGAEVVLTNRTTARAELVRQALGHSVKVIGHTDVGDVVSEVDLIVHTASVGLDGETMAMSYDLVQAAAAGRCGLLLDVVYAPRETALVRSAREVGIKAADGLGMLVHQAGAAYRLIWGDEPPLEVMRTAAWTAAGRSSA